MKNNFDLYFAGSQRKDVMDEMQDRGYCKLFSFAGERNNIERWVERDKVNGKKGKLMVDSGAFSVYRRGATIDINEYIDFINNNIDGIDLVIQLDKIPGVYKEEKTKEQVDESVEQTWNNFLYMVEKVKNPKKIMPVFHQFENFNALKRMLDFKYSDGTPIEYICISPSKNVGADYRLQWYGECFDIIHNSSNPNVKIHALGNQIPLHIESYPFASADATTWLRNGFLGRIITEYGIYLISDVQEHSPDNICNDEVSTDVIKEYVENRGYDFEELKSNTQKRLIFNAEYFYERIMLKGKPRYIKKRNRRLF